MTEKAHKPHNTFTFFFLFKVVISQISSFLGPSSPPILAAFSFLLVDRASTGEVKAPSSMFVFKIYLN